MPRVDPRFERIAARLTVLQLQTPTSMSRTERPDEADADDEARFAQYYSPRGLETVIHEYGLDAKLRAIGLDDYRLRVTEDDPFRQRLELVLPDGTHIMDLRLHLSRGSVGLGDDARDHDGRGDARHFDLVVVDWLSMQNPRAQFSRARPRLPGQQFPGTGLGRDVASLLVIMCRRIGRDGLLVVPERFHLAELYKRGGWRALRPEDDRAIVDVQAGAIELGFAARAWAVERGFVRDDAGAPYQYAAHERLEAVSPALEAAFAPGGVFQSISETVKEISGLLRRPRRFHVDVEALRRSLREDPIEGMDPDDLRR